MPKKTPNKYFAGQLDKPKCGLPYRIFRQRKSVLGTIIDEVPQDWLEADEDRL